MFDLPIEIWLEIVGQLDGHSVISLLDLLASSRHQSLYHHLLQAPIEIAVGESWSSVVGGYFTIEQWRAISHKLEQVKLRPQLVVDYDLPSELVKHTYQKLAREPRVNYTCWNTVWDSPPDLRSKTVELVSDPAHLLFSRPNLRQIQMTDVKSNIDLIQYRRLYTVSILGVSGPVSLTLPPSVTKLVVSSIDSQPLKIEWPEGAPHLKGMFLNCPCVDWPNIPLPSLEKLVWMVENVDIDEVEAMAPKLVHGLETPSSMLTSLRLNKVSQIPDLREHPHLLSVDLSDNNFSEISISHPTITKVIVDHNYSLSKIALPSQVVEVSAVGCDFVSADSFPRKLEVLDLSKNPLDKIQDLSRFANLERFACSEGVYELIELPVRSRFSWKALNRIKFRGYPENEIPPTLSELVIFNEHVPFKFHSDLERVSIVINWYPEAAVPDFPLHVKDIRIHRTKLVTFPSLESQTINNFWPQLGHLQCLRRLEITDRICVDINHPVVLPMSVEWVSLNISSSSQHVVIKFAGRGDTNLRWLSIENGVAIPIYWSWKSIGQGTTTNHPHLEMIRCQWAPGSVQFRDWLMPWPLAIKDQVFQEAPGGFRGFWWENLVYLR